MDQYIQSKANLSNTLNIRSLFYGSKSGIGGLILLGGGGSNGPNFAGKLYTYDIESDQLTEQMTHPNLQWQFSINSAGELYSVTEVSGMPQGSMYKIDTSSNTSTLIGATGTPSLWGMGFDSSDQLWAVDEFYQKYGTMNTSTGAFTATSSKNSYKDTYYAIPDDNGNLYSFNVAIPSGIVKYNISTNTAELILPLAVNWAGLAYGSYKSK